MQSSPATTDALSQIQDLLGGAPNSGDLLTRAVLTVGIVGAAWLVRRALIGVIQRQVDKTRTRYYVGKTVGYVLVVLALVSIGLVWLPSLGSVGTFLGLLTAGVAIALRDLIADLAGWIFILVRNPFDVGDRIEIGAHKGDVIDIRAFKFSILEIGNWVDADQSTGRVIHIPNAEVFRMPLANATVEFPFIWNEMPILVTFESDWRRAKTVIAEIVSERMAEDVDRARRSLHRTGQRYLIHYGTITPAVFTSVRDSGILLTARYLCDPRARRGSAEGIWEALLDAFAREEHVDWAYPTIRTYLNPLEGKPGTSAPLPDRWTEAPSPSS